MSSEGYHAAERPVPLPPADFNQRKMPVCQLPAAVWYRVHDVRFAAIYFSLNPGHRFSHLDAARKCLYLGSDIETCLYERFGDRMNQEPRLPLSLWENGAVSEVSVPPLVICDLTSDRTRTLLGIDLSTVMYPSLKVPQAWGKALQEHPAKPAGLRYSSRFSARPCLCLFEGATVALQDKKLGPLPQIKAANDFLETHRIALL